MQRERERDAFSLVELSIVLVILGLLIGGVLVGRSLVRAAELRSVATDLNRFQTAIYAFKDKYFALPGDMTNATSFWSGTADGNGDLILSIGGDGLRAWQHMALAGLIEGSYTGTPDTQATHIGGSVPQAKWGKMGYEIENYTKASSGWTNGDSATANNEIRIGPIYTGGGLTRLHGASFSTEEMWNLDTKIDDGLPGTGKIYVYGNAFGTCSTTNDVTTSVYSQSTTGIVCMPHYILK